MNDQPTIFHEKEREPDTSVATLAVALAHREAGRLAAAEGTLRRILAWNIVDAPALAHLAHIQLLRRRNDEAETLLRRAETLAPDDPLILRNRARLALQAQKLDIAAAAGARAVAADPADPENRLLHATLLSSQGRPDDGLRMIAALLAERPDYAEALANRAAWHLSRQDIAAAITDAARAVGIKPHLTPLWRLLAGLFHQSGQIPIACQALRSYLVLEPDDASALFDLADLARLTGQLMPAKSALARSLALAPDLADDPVRQKAILAFAQALRVAGQESAASDILAFLASRYPDNVPLVIALAASYVRQERWSEAEYWTRAALSKEADKAELWTQLGSILLSADRPDAACDALDTALRLNPDFAQAHQIRGNALRRLGRFDEAIAHYALALAVKPDFTEAHSNLALAFKDLGRFDDAIKHWEIAGYLMPGLADTHNNLGNAMRAQGNPGTAIKKHQRAIRLRADFADAYHGLGNTLQDVGKLDDAVVCYKNALSIAPDFVGVLTNFGAVRKEQGQLAEALSWLERALAHSRSEATFEENYGLALFCVGRLREAWRSYERRKIAPLRAASMSMFDGSHHPGKELLILAEQGIGDQILGCSMISEAAERFGSCVVECDPRLVDLLSRSFPAITIVARETPPAPRTYHASAQVSMFSLGQYFRNELADFPRHDGYLMADPVKVARWKAWLDGLGPGRKIGFSWRGRLLTADRSRSFVPLERLAPVLNLPGLIFVNLQYDESAQDIDRLRQQTGQRIHTADGLDLTNDLDEVAALITALDAVVGPSTAPGILAGALGKPSWIYAYYPATYEKELCGATSMPWLPSVRVESWAFGEEPDRAIARIAEDLSHFIDQPPGGGFPAPSPQPESDPIAQALSYREAGRYPDAESILRNVLRDHEGDVPALAHLAHILLLSKRDDEAEALLRRAESLAPGDPLISRNRARWALRAQRLDRAAAAGARAIAADPTHHENRLLQATLLSSQGRPDDALRIIEALLVERPDYAEALANRAALHQGRQNLAAALADASRAVAIKPHLAAVWRLLAGLFKQDGHTGKAFDAQSTYCALEPDDATAAADLADLARRLGKVDLARAILQQAVRTAPELPLAWVNYGAALQQSGENEDAVKAYGKALTLDPRSPEIRNNLGATFKDMGHLDLAIAHFLAALRLNAGFAEAHFNLGVVFKDQAKLGDAVLCYQQALCLRPDYGDALLNLASVLKEQNRLPEALTLYERSWALLPDQPAFPENYGLALFCVGRLREAWRSYERRKIAPLRAASMSMFDGSHHPGKELLILAEQGIGDQILGCSMISEAAERFGSCVVECDPRLVDLLSRSFPAITIVARETPPAPRTYHASAQVSMFSLGQYFRNELADFPRHDGYLMADPVKVARWKAWLDGLGPGRKIGFSWRGRLLTADRSRSFVPLERLAPVLNLPGLIFVNLQYDESAQDIDRLRQQTGQRIHTADGLDLTNDLDEVAALITALDAVVGPSTAPGILAGALGKPSWIYAYYPATYEKELCGATSMPWLPSVRVESWAFGEEPDRAIARIAEDLSHFIDQPPGGGFPAPSPQPESDPIAQALSYREAGRYPDAESILRNVLRDHDGDVPALAHLAHILLLSKRDDEAEALLRRAESLAPGDPLISRNRARWALRAQRLDRAAAAGARAIAADPTHHENRLLQATLLSSQGRPDDALRIIEALLVERPDYAEALANRAALHQGRQNLAAALADASRAVAIKPHLAAVWRLLAGLFKQDGHTGKAFDAQSTYCALEPDDATAAADLADLARRLGKVDLARAILQQALTQSPDSLPAWVNLGTILQDEQIGEAMAAYGRALFIQPALPEVYNNLSRALHKQGRCEDAVACVMTAVRLQPDFAESLCNLGHILQDLDQPPSASAAYKAAMLSDPHGIGTEAAVYLALLKYLEEDAEACEEALQTARPLLSNQTPQNEHSRRYLSYLLSLVRHRGLVVDPGKPADSCCILHVIGESHCFSAHGNLVRFAGKDMRCRSHWIYGGKQWHFGQEGMNSHKHKFQAILRHLPRDAAVLLLFGEIDCRPDEGIMKAWESHPDRRLEDIVRSTVQSYLAYIAKAVAPFGHKVIIGGVPATNIPLAEMDGKRAELFVDLIRSFNVTLKSKSLEAGMHFLDVYALTDRGDGIATGTWHIDHVHLLPEAVVEAFATHCLAA